MDKPIYAKKKLYLETVGCQMNVLDSELGRRQSAPPRAMKLSETAEAADVIFLQYVAAFRQHAEDKIYKRPGPPPTSQENASRRDHRRSGLHGPRRTKS